MVIFLVYVLFIAYQTQGENSTKVSDAALYCKTALGGGELWFKYDLLARCFHK